MKDLAKSALSIIGILFAGLLIAFTGYQTFMLLNEVSGSPVIAVIGLVMFEIGMLYWWSIFRHEAEGLLQMALSLLMFLACLTFVILATSLKLGAVDAEVLGVNTPAKIIAAAALIQLAAKLFFPLFHPDVLQAIKERVQEGKILKAADDKFDKRIDGIAAEYAEAMVEERTVNLLTRFNTKYHTRYQLSAGPQPLVIEGQVAAPDEAPPAPKRSFMDRLRPRPAPAASHVDDAAIAAYLERNPAALSHLVAAARPDSDVSNPTHASPRHDAGHAGQGDAGNGAPPPVFGASPEDFR